MLSFFIYSLRDKLGMFFYTRVNMDMTGYVAVKRKQEPFNQEIGLHQPPTTVLPDVRELTSVVKTRAHKKNPVSETTQAL